MINARGINYVFNKRRGVVRMKEMKTLMVLLALTLVVIIIPVHVRAESKPVLRVNDSVMNEFDMREAIEQLVPSTMFHGGVDQRKMEKYRDRAIEAMIEHELLYQASIRKKIKVKKKAIDAEEEIKLKRFRNEEQYEKAIASVGLTRDEFRLRLKKKIAIEKLIETEVEEKSKVSDKEVRRYYEDNKVNFMLPESRHLREIQINADPSAPEDVWQEKKKLTEDVREKALNGEDFAQLAWDYSTDRFRVKSGDLGVVHKGRLLPELQEAAWQLNEGEMTGVIRTIYGFHIIKVEQIIPARQYEFDEAGDKIRKLLVEEKQKRLKEDILSEQRELSEIEIY
jgi:parvulin-like peptidyl-prolyl isomerase